MYRVGIIGLGSIAARYSNPADAYPYCHTGGIRFCESTELVAVADISPERREEFQKTWGPAFPEGSITYYETDKQMLESEKLDIVAVCVRGPYHFKVMQEVLKADIKAIFLEKPAGCSLAEVDGMTTAADAKGIPIVVDYSRHWAPHLLRLQSLVKDGLVGEVKSVIGYCGGTILSFAIHTTDLICQFAGYDPVSVSAFVQPHTGEVPPPYEPEPSIIGATIRFKSGVQGFHVGSPGCMTGFSVDVLGSEGRLRAGMYIGTALHDKNGKQIDNATLGLPENASVFKMAYQQITDYLDGGPVPHCARGEYLAVNEIGFATIESGLTGQTIQLPCQNRNRLIFANG
ncbi:Gfo/Idh/MocA family oxidoreductase [Candidatus Poribacteria bacterium]|nr:Gfo/Idh/MocA family oxidoreductase [Candidatus Poribacteria bacterium]